MTCAREAAVREAEERLRDRDARDVLRVWDASQSQWRVGAGGPTGLDYVAVWRVVAPALGVGLSEEGLRLLQALEADQLNEWADAADKRRQEAASARPGRVR